MKYFIVIFILIVSCQPQSTIETPSIKQVKLEHIERGNIDSILNIAEIISLETRAESLIIKIDKLIMAFDHFFVFDRSQHEVFKFDLSGNFMNKVNKKGTGPEEFEVIYDMIINPSDGNIELLSPDGTVYIYDQEGNYINKFGIPDVLSVHKFEYISKDLLAFYSINHQAEYNLWVYSRSKKGYLSKYKSPITEFDQNNIAIISRPLVPSVDKVYFVNSFTNDIYGISDEGVVLDYSWDFGVYNFNENKLVKNRSKDYYLDFLSTYFNTSFTSFLSFSNYAESEKYIFNQFPYGKELATCLYDKDSKSYKLFKGIFPSQGFQILDDYLITFVMPEDLEKSVEQHLLTTDQESIVKSMNSAENPVILKYQIK